MVWLGPTFLLELTSCPPDSPDPLVESAPPRVLIICLWGGVPQVGVGHAGPPLKWKEYEGIGNEYSNGEKGMEYANLHS